MLVANFSMVAGVVDVELAPDVCARAGEHLGQRVAEHAAARVAHVHGTGGVGGDELDHDLLPLKRVAAAVVRALALHRAEHVAVPGRSQAEVYEPGTGSLGAREPAAVQLEVGYQRVGYFPGSHAQRLCAGHGVVGGEVAVGRILGYLHHARERGCLGQLALFGRADLRGGEQLADLPLGGFNKICHYSIPCLVP